MAQNHANRSASTVVHQTEYLESYQRLVASWIEAFVQKQSEARLADFTASNQRTRDRLATMGASADER